MNGNASERREEEIRQEALRQARAEMVEEVKQEIVGVIGELLERLWERLAPIIGQTATAAIFHSASYQAARDHPFLEGVEVDETGLRLDRLRENLENLDRAAVRMGLLALMDSIVSLLTDLTGTVLVRQVEPLVQRFREEVEKVE